MSKCIASCFRLEWLMHENTDDSAVHNLLAVTAMAQYQLLWWLQFWRSSVDLNNSDCKFKH